MDSKRRGENTMDTRTMENADRTRRVSAMAKSAARYFLDESKILSAAIRIGREHLAANPHDDETRASTAELERQRDELYNGWKNSSIRRHVEDQSAEASAIHGSEERSLVAEASGRTTSALSRVKDTDQATETATRLAGYATVFNTWTDLGYFKERIAPGAFTAAIKTSDCRFLFNHDSNFLYGRTRASTLELAEDRIGLKFTCYLLPYDAASYALARRIDRLDISGCSFSFTVKRDSWKFAPTPGGLDERTIEEIEQLYDVGPVVFPAYPTTTVSAVFESVQRTAPAAASPVVTPTRTVPTPTRRHPATLADRLYAQRQLDQARFEWESKNWALVQKEKSYWRAMGESEQAAAKKIDLLFQKHFS
jgi:hypothetical protein